MSIEFLEVMLKLKKSFIFTLTFTFFIFYIFLEIIQVHIENQDSLLVHCRLTHCTKRDKFLWARAHFIPRISSQYKSYINVAFPLHLMQWAVAHKSLCLLIQFVSQEKCNQSLPDFWLPKNNMAVFL